MKMRVEWSSTAWIKYDSTSTTAYLKKEEQKSAKSESNNLLCTLDTLYALLYIIIISLHHYHVSFACLFTFRHGIFMSFARPKGADDDLQQSLECFKSTIIDLRK